MSNAKDLEFNLLSVDITEPCPYMRGRMQTITSVDTSVLPSDQPYHAISHLITTGYYPDSDNTMTTYNCKQCFACYPCRTVASEFQPSPSLKKAFRKNADLNVRVVENETDVDLDEHNELMKNYMNARHQRFADSDDAYVLGEWKQHLSYNLSTKSLSVYLAEHRATDNTLVGSIHFSPLQNGLFGHFFYYDPAYMKRGIGNAIIMNLIYETAQRGLNYTYFGPWTDEETALHYKSRFRPFEILTPDGWQELNPGAEVLPF